MTTEQTNGLMVYWWTEMHRGKQVRAILAARSLAEVIRATGLSRRFLKNYGSITSNEDDIRVATSRPGIIFRRGLDDRHGEWVADDPSGSR